MKSNSLLPLLGSFLYFALPTLSQLQRRQQNAPPPAGGTILVGGSTFYFTSGTTFYFTGSETTQAATATRHSVTPTTRVVTISPVTISGKVVSATYSGEFLPLPTDSAATPSATTTPTRSRDQLKNLILDALAKVPNVELFTALIKSESDIFELLDPESNYTILAPNNDAVKAKTGGNWRRSGGYPPELALSFVGRGFREPSLKNKPNTLKTELKDPKYANLGPNEPARIVSAPVSTNGTNGTNFSILASIGDSVSIVAGMGESVSFGADIPFDAGTILVGDSFFTLPQDLSTTLRGTNGGEFEKFLSSSGQLGNLTNSERMTIFALTDSAVASAGSQLTTAALDQHVVRGFLGYTPDLVSGQVINTAGGGKIVVTIVGGNYFVNGLKIVRSNVIMKNGVVHYVEGIIGPGFVTQDHSIAARLSISPSIMLLAMVAAFTRYWLMV